MPSLRETAVHLAVSYCATHQMEDLISKAEEIYKFLAREEAERNYKDAVENLVNIMKREL